MIQPPRSMPAPNIERLSIQSWSKGYISAFDAGRMPHSGLVKMTNTRLRQNGTVGPRPGLMQYGEPLPGEILGFDSFVEVVDNKRVQKLLVIARDSNDSNTASAYVSLDGIGWQKQSGETFHKDAHPTFTQARDRMVITNGEDYLSYYDIKAKKIIRPQALTNVTGVTAVATSNIAGQNITIYYCVTAIRGGETARSDAAVVKVNKDRSEWRGINVDTSKGEQEETVTISWNKVTGAEYYVIYAGISATSMRFMKVVPHNSTDSNTKQTFKDSGSDILNPNVTPPNSNSTAGVRASRSVLVGSRLYLLGDKDDLWKVTFGGADPDTMLDFSAFAGGFIRINAGSKEIPVAMRSFRNGRGDAVPMVLCSETNGNGSLKYLQSANMQLDSVNLQWISVVDDNGRDGTDSPDAVVVYQNALIYPSRQGFKTTTTKPQMQNVLSTESLADNIWDNIELLNNNYISRALGQEMNGMIYFAMPVGADRLNQLWVLDMKRGGAWAMPWTIDGIKDMKVYGSSDGKSRFLIAIGNKLMELTDDAKHTDGGEPFLADIGSGIVKFSKDGAMWTSVVDITFVLLRPTGRVRFSVSGKTEDEPLQELINFTKDFTPQFVPEGWNSVCGWNSGLGWGLVDIERTGANGEVRVTITKDIDEDVNWLQYSVSSDEAGTDYELSDVIVQHVPIGVIFEEDEEDL